MFITPLSAAPTGAGSDPATYSAAHPGTVWVNAPGVDSVVVVLQVVDAAVSVRPYFWEPDDGSGKIANGGRWVGLGYDATSGSSPTTADPSEGNGCSHGRWQDEDGGQKSWCLVVEAGDRTDVVWAKLKLQRRSTVTT